jgi:nucleotide-binding universal stress UspA family protein
MYRVLLAVNPDRERAMQAAKTITTLPGDPADIEVVVLNVARDYEITGDGATVSAEDHYDETEYPESVTAAAELLESAGFSVVRRRELGDPETVILDVAEEIDADCIALAGRKRSPTGKVLFGSVTQSVMLHTERPVLATMSE